MIAGIEFGEPDFAIFGTFLIIVGVALTIYIAFFVGNDVILDCKPLTNNTNHSSTGKLF